MKPTGSILFLAAAGACLLCGCVQQPAWAVVQRRTIKYTMEDADRFVPLDEYSYDSVACTGLQEQTLPDGRLKVVADVKNRSGAAIAIQMRCVFNVSTGAETSGATPWKWVGLPGAGTQTVEFTAFQAGQANYVIRVRRAR